VDRRNRETKKTGCSLPSMSEVEGTRDADLAGIDVKDEWLVKIRMDKDGS